MDKVVRVLSTLALKGAMSGLTDQSQAAIAMRIDADFAPTVGLLERMRQGEAADVVILTREGIDELVAEGAVAADSKLDLARSYVGVAVKAGDPHPDITTREPFCRALLAARSVAYSRIGASGIFFAKLIEQLGIAADINARAVITTGFTAERLISGEADLAIQQISELKQVPGVEIVGPIPYELQTPVIFSAGRMAASRQPVAANALLTFLGSREAAPALRESGLEP
jgi:molybdate transport system substrate-binding protein